MMEICLYNMKIEINQVNNNFKYILIKNVI